MKILHYFSMIERIDFWIHAQKTGTPEEFGRKLGLSDRRLRDYIAMMKDMGAPITYSRTLGTYMYEKPGRFNVQFNFQFK